MTIRAIFDANVLASGFLGLTRAGSGPPAELLRLWMLGRFTLIVSEPILEEVEFSAFSSAYFESVLPVEARERAISALRNAAVNTEITKTVRGVASDPDDDHVLAAAMSSAAAYIVSGDRTFLSIGSYQGIDLVNPRQFLELLESDQSPEVEAGART